MAQQNPQMAEAVTTAKLQKIEARKAVLIAEMMEEFLKEEREVSLQVLVMTLLLS